MIYIHTGHGPWQYSIHVIFLSAPLRSLSSPAPGPGDVDGDGQVVITDVIGMISLVSSGAELPAYCDVNGDGEVNITDITTLINMIVMAE